MTIQFENASLEQAPFLTDLALESNGYYGSRIVSDEAARRVFLVTDHHFKCGVVRLLKISSDIIGFYGLAPIKDAQGQTMNYLTHLFLRPKYIGKGWGKILFQEAMTAAKEDLQWEALLWISDPKAAWFYHKMGAKQIGDLPCPLNPPERAPIFVYLNLSQ